MRQEKMVDIQSVIFVWRLKLSGTVGLTTFTFPRGPDGDVHGMMPEMTNGNDARAWRENPPRMDSG